MVKEHASRRAYNSPRRQQQAAATRRAILEAAERLFLQDGYPATTMEAIAAEAGVSLKTAYLPFSTKSGLLRALWDLRLKSDDADAPVVHHEWFREVLEEPDPVRKLQLNARNSAAAKTRIGGLFRVIRGAAETDRDCGALWRLIQRDFYANQQMIVESIHRGGGLRRGLSVATGTDILWTLNLPDAWMLLAGQRGWSPTPTRPGWHKPAARNYSGRRSPDAGAGHARLAGSHASRTICTAASSARFPQHLRRQRQPMPRIPPPCHPQRRTRDDRFLVTPVAATSSFVIARTPIADPLMDPGHNLESCAPSTGLTSAIAGRAESASAIPALAARMNQRWRYPGQRIKHTRMQ